MEQYLSQEGLEKTKKELEYLKNVKRKEIAIKIEEAKSFGDLSENAEYQSAREEQAFNEGKIRALEEAVKTAVIITKRKGNKVIIGSTIEVKVPEKKNKEPQEYTIVGLREANPMQGKISHESPLGKGFLGHKVGDVVKIETPTGKMTYKILKIK